MHIVPDDDHAQLWRMSGPACVTAISHHQWSAFPDLKPAAVIPHGLDVPRFPFSPKAGDYVCYLGRFTSGKGPRQAILAAREAGVKIILAGPENAYFHEHVKPLIDGSTAEFIGPVNPDERNRLLSGARALVYPIQYPETFGLVLVEAMLCGTPVAAIRLGAVPEIIEDGVNGVTVDRKEEMAAAIRRCFALDRARVRRVAEQRFSADRMARDYVTVYEQTLRQR
jgi:glycosyltransferase involved in cell wall biosynthesis